MIKLHGVGGYDEVGKNMTALETGSDVFLFDAGLYLPAIVGVQEKEKIPTESGMRSLGALPNDLYLDKKGLRNKVRAMLISHAHLDHVGAVQYLAPRYKAGVYGTPFTMEVLDTLMADNNHSIPNHMYDVQPNEKISIKGQNKKYKVEFINMTHSTIQCTVIAVHTPDGVVLYTNDYKLDNTPVIGDKPNYKRLKELSKQGIKAIVADSLYAPVDRKTPSEKIARGLLEDVLFTTENYKSGLVITTFSSHIARLKSIVDFGQRLNRKILFVGRSLNKYTSAAIKIGKCPFKNKVQIVTYRNQVERMLKKANSNKKDYLVVCTGHQGEPGSILDRIARNKLTYKISPDDHIIFSSKTIPTPENLASRAELDKHLRKHKPRIFDNVHVSGHGGREDLRDLIKLTNPEHVIPSHGDFSKTQAGMNLAIEMGYKKDYNVHLLSNSKVLNLK
jgi:ribonuclease J